MRFLKPLIAIPIVTIAMFISSFSFAGEKICDTSLTPSPYDVVSKIRQIEAQQEKTRSEESTTILRSIGRYHLYMYTQPSDIKKFTEYSGLVSPNGDFLLLLPRYDDEGQLEGITISILTNADYSTYDKQLNNMKLLNDHKKRYVSAIETVLKDFGVSNQPPDFGYFRGGYYNIPHGLYTKVEYHTDSYFFEKSIVTGPHAVPIMESVLKAILSL